MGLINGKAESLHASALKTGDIVLIRKPLVTHLGPLDTGVVHGIASAQNGNCFTAQLQRLPGESKWSALHVHTSKLWTGYNGIGIVIVSSDATVLLEANSSGVVVRPLAKRLRELHEDGARVRRASLRTRANCAHPLFSLIV